MPTPRRRSPGIRRVRGPYADALFAKARAENLKRLRAAGRLPEWAIETVKGIDHVGVDDEEEAKK